MDVQLAQTGSVYRLRRNHLLSNLKIGFEAKRAYFNHRGLGTYARLLITGLAKYFNQNHYYLFSPRNKKNLFPESNDFSCLHPRHPSGWSRMMPASFWRRYLQTSQVKKLNLNIYHGLSHEIPVGIEKLPIKTLVTIHDLLYLTNPQFFPWIDRQIYHSKFQDACKRAHHIIAVSKETKLDIQKHFGITPNKITVCYQTCDPMFYEPLPTNDLLLTRQRYQISSTFILSVGAFEQRKNTRGLIQAYAALPTNVRPQLVLVGQGVGKYRLEMEKDIRDLHLTRDVKILTSLTRKEVVSLYQMATIFAYPSFFEGFGIPNIEALFSGVPVVTSDRACLRESAGPGALYIQPEKIETLTQALQRLLESQTLANQLGRAGKSHVQRFHQQNTSEALIDLYNKVCEVDHNSKHAAE